MNNGCLCCSVRSDLAPIVQQLYLGQAKTGKLDGIIVETTGLAVPGPVLQTFMRDAPALVTRLDSVVTLVDAANVGRHLQRAREASLEQEEAQERAGAGEEGGAEVNECIEQIAFADLLLLNKVDLVPRCGLLMLSNSVSAAAAAAAAAAANGDAQRGGAVRDRAGGTCTDLDPPVVAAAAARASALTDGSSSPTAAGHQPARPDRALDALRRGPGPRVGRQGL